MTDVQEGKHIEPSAVAGEEPDRDQEDLHGDEEAPARNVRNPKDPLLEERAAQQQRIFTKPGLVSSVCERYRQGGPAQGKGVG